MWFICCQKSLNFIDIFRILTDCSFVNCPFPCVYICKSSCACQLGINNKKRQEAQLSPRDRAMRRVNWNLANCHATVQKLLIRLVLTKWSWRFSRRQCVIDNVHSTMTRPSSFHCLRCVINKPTTDDLWISPVYRRLAVAKFSKSTI